MFSSLIPQDVLDFQRVSWLHSSKYVSGEVLDGSDKKVVVQGFVPNLVVFSIEIKSDMWSELLQVFRQGGTCCELFDSSYPSSKTYRRDFLNFDEDNPSPSVLSREVQLPNISWPAIEV